MRSVEGDRKPVHSALNSHNPICHKHTIDRSITIDLLSGFGSK